MDAAGEVTEVDLLPGEQVLWTGRPARGRRTRVETLWLLYLGAVAPVLIAATAWQMLRHPPAAGPWRVFPLLILCGGAAECAVATWYLLRLPRERSVETYRVTDRRVLVTYGTRRRRTSSAWLDQVGEPRLVSPDGAVSDLALGGPARQRRPARLVLLARQSVVEPGGAHLFRLLAADDAREAVQALADARRRLPDRGPDLRPPAAGSVAVPVPSFVRLLPGERVLWTGRPRRVPWWYGADDVQQSLGSAFLLVAVGLLAATAAVDGAVLPLVWVSVLGFAGGFHPALGRVLLRRWRAVSCTYVLTDRRVLTAWRIRRPVTVEARLVLLLPPVVRGRCIRTDWAEPPDRRARWGDLAWPFATGQAPVLVHPGDEPEVWQILALAQWTARSSGRLGGARPGAGKGAGDSHVVPPQASSSRDGDTDDGAWARW